jgi:mannose-1-phosphate guanylyltransferase / phosphomannomutase
MKQAVILCGGKGTRLGEAFSDLPKPLVPVCGVPLLDRILEKSAAAGASRVILAAGHLGEQIRERYKGSNRWNLEIHVHIEAKPLGTGGCLHEIAHLLDEDFLLLYGDVFLDFDLSALVAHHLRSHPVATVLVRQSDHPKDSDLVALDPHSDRVTAFLPKATRNPNGIYHNWGNAAVYACSRSLLDHIPKDISSDIATHAFPEVLASGGEILAHHLETTGFVKDMGTPARLIEVERYCIRKALAAESLLYPQKIRAVILDRDGVILRDNGPSTEPETIEFMPQALKGLADLHSQNLACMVATNQPWIARGLLTEQQLNQCHLMMMEAIAANSGKIADIAHSPYHPETHHGEGIPELRRASECRKPRPGMLFSLMETSGFLPSETVMIGDSEADVIAAKNAGVRSILIGDNTEALNARPDAHARDISHAASVILSWNKNLP